MFWWKTLLLPTDQPLLVVWRLKITSFESKPGPGIPGSLSIWKEPANISLIRSTWVGVGTQGELNPLRGNIFFSWPHKYQILLISKNSSCHNICMQGEDLQRNRRKVCVIPFPVQVPWNQIQGFCLFRWALSPQSWRHQELSVVTIPRTLIVIESPTGLLSVAFPFFLPFIAESLTWCCFSWDKITIPVDIHRGLSGRLDIIVTWENR